MEKSFVKNVVEFNKKVLGIKQRKLGLLSMSETLITNQALAEELEEFGTACDDRDLVGCIDALIDLQYFAVGAMYKMGMTSAQIEKCMSAVHQANMTKRKGVNKKRGDGKAADAVKPTGWTAPEERIKKIMRLK